MGFDITAYAACNEEAYARSFETVEDVIDMVDRMRTYYQTGSTRQVEMRIRNLKALRSWLKSHETEVLVALREDLGKQPFEGYMTELGLVYEEIRTCLAKIRTWTRPKGVSTPLYHFPSSSKVVPAPLGVVALLSPWNYPLQLALIPLVDAITAGNCCVLKTSKTSPHTSQVLRKLCCEVFDSRFVYCLPSELPQMNQWVLRPTYEKVFFTGSPSVAKEILHAAADSLTPVTLELGGKSPCFVDKSANIKRAAQRIAWGKCVNAGQTCVAPDYLLVHESVVEDLVTELRYWLEHYYGKDILHNDEYPHMVNEHHFDRVCHLIDGNSDAVSCALGGGRDRETLRIEPTVLTGVNWQDPVMAEEIFGPVLPIIAWNEDTLGQIFAKIASLGHPLACYVFADDVRFQNAVLSRVEFGGATINDVLVHMTNNHMGFGGVGQSGMGSYHGKCGFDCFTHYQSILIKSNLLELPVRVPPFGNKLALMRHIMRP